MRHTLSLSGGKDSTFLLFELVRRGEPLDECVFFDTGWEFPQMYKHLERLEKFCADRGIKFTTLHPARDFDYTMFDKPVKEKDGGLHYGYSWCGARGIRWGTTEKTKALDRHNANSITYIGLAADEPDRIEKNRAKNKVFPLSEWGVTEAECLTGCYAEGYDWGGLYELLDRVSCKYCAAKNLKELRNIYFKMPDVWAELRDRQSRTPRPFKGAGKSIFDLEARFEFEIERQAAGLSITSREFYKALSNRLEGVKR